MKTIQPCLWFDQEAEDAAKFYTSIFKNSKIGKAVPYGKTASKASGQPEGSIMTVEFELEGLKFLGLNGGPHFKMSPSISLFVGCQNENEIAELWGKLAKEVRMELKSYPFAEKYGWCEDRFGVNWQLMLSSRKQKITPALLFANEQFGKAEDAIQYYTSQFPNSKLETLARDEKTRAILHATFTLNNQHFVAMESPLPHDFGFTPGISFMVNCEDQKEIDKIWHALSAVPDAEQCGWLKDKYGVSWQIIFNGWAKILSESDAITRERLMKAIIEMKKFDLNVMQNALR